MIRPPQVKTRTNTHCTYTTSYRSEGIVTLSGANHATRTLTASLAISKAQPVIPVATTQSHVYDGTEKAVIATLVPAGLTDQLQYSPQSSFTNVGEHRVRVYLNESMNYLAAEAYPRPEERRVGKECVRTGRSRWSTYP